MNMKLPLSDDAKELLREAKLVDGFFEEVLALGRRAYVVAGARKFIGDPEFQRRYIDALRELEGAGLVERAGKSSCYELSSDGWAAAKEL